MGRLRRSRHRADTARNPRPSQRWPDGITLDGKDAAWVTNPIGHEILHVRVGGAITDRIHTGDYRPVSCALDARENTLYACAAPPITDAKRMIETRQSALLKIRVNRPTHSAR